MICTGFGPTVAAVCVGMYEPVTITRSVSATASGEGAGVGEGVGLCANTPETTSERMYPLLIQRNLSSNVLGACVL